MGKSYKQLYAAEQARAELAEKELADARAELKQWRKTAQQEQARASRAVKLLQDGTEAGELRQQLAAARAELDSMRAQASWQQMESGQKCFDGKLEAVSSEPPGLLEAQAERDRLAAEIAALKRAKGGRPKRFDREQEAYERALEIRQQGKTMLQTAAAMQVSESTLRRLLRRGAMCYN